MSAKEFLIIIINRDVFHRETCKKGEKKRTIKSYIIEDIVIINVSLSKRIFFSKR